jgi:hypothetical protein
MAAVGVLFSTLEPRSAGLIAAVLFVVLGFGTLMSTRRTSRRGWTFFAACLYMVGAVLPILLIRFLNWDTEFRDTSLLGVSGPTFHRVSRYIYLAMMVATLRDFFHFRRAVHSG